MSGFYILGLDQSTQGTKGVLVDKNGCLIARADRAHRQIISEEGWVSHDLNEIWNNVLQVLREVVEKSGIKKEQIACIGITNQRETIAAWDRESGKPLADAIVWQCSRAAEICDEIEEKMSDPEEIYRKTGIMLSPFFPAAKMSWLLRNNEKVQKAAREKRLAFGTIDSYLVYRLTDGKEFRTDYSNASRTQLFDITSLEWDEDLCRIFGVPAETLPEVTDSDMIFGTTTIGGWLDKPIAIAAVLGDSHGALFGHGCLEEGDIKVTYGTGSSIMMNLGEKYSHDSHGLSTSLAWKYKGRVSYVLEGNINYSGAVITWLKDDLKLIHSAKETEELIREANQDDGTYIVPAFSGLGAPWWNNKAKAMIWGMSRTTGKNEIVKAACECIAYQINDVVRTMRADTGLAIPEICADGGATSNQYLMQFQSSITNADIKIPNTEEMSVLGVVYMAGISRGLYPEEIFQTLQYDRYLPDMEESMRREKTEGWINAVEKLW